MPASKRSKKPVAIVAAVLAVLLCVGGVAVWQFQQKAEWDRSHAFYTLPIDLDAIPAAYDPDSSTPVPVKVEGTDFEGTAFSQTYYLTPDANTIEAPRGTYTVAPAGDVVREGVLYRTNDEAVDVVVDEEGWHTASEEEREDAHASESKAGESSSSSAALGTDDPAAAPENAQANKQGDGEADANTQDESQSQAANESAPSDQDAFEISFEYEPIAPEDVTDEQLTSLTEWLGDSDVQQEQAQHLVETVKQKREDRLAEIGEEEKAAEEAEAARVQARKEAIEATAYEYIYRAYDQAEPNLRDSKNREPFVALYSPQSERGNFGWLMSSLISIDYFEVVNEDTVYFTVTYEYGTPDSHRTYTENKTLVFDENALILSGAVGMIS